MELLLEEAASTHFFAVPVCPLLFCQEPEWVSAGCSFRKLSVFMEVQD